MRNSLKTFFGLAILVMVLGFSSCFDILEEYEFNADGSGKAKIVMDVSKMMALMEGLGSALDSAADETGKVDDSMAEMFNDTKVIDNLKSVPGIKNIVNLNNRETSTIGYSFEFANVEALNAALIVRGNDLGMGEAMGMSVDDANETEKDNSISFAGKKFSRKLDMKMEEKEDADDEDKESAAMAKMMFKDAKYTLRYTFANGVKKVKGNDAAVIGADHKTVTIENSLSDLLEGNATMSTDIRLK